MIVAPSAEYIHQAAKLLAAGEIVGLPTETVYGLASDASSASAVAKIYAAKNRPANHPLIVHLAPQADIAFWANTLPAYAQSLIHAFWPGPLTLVLPRTAQAGNFITGGQNTVAVRCPSHPVAQALLQTCLTMGVQGLAAPSANRFGKVSPTTAQHVADEFGNRIFTLDGGACDVGIESTIVDCTQANPRILRHGAIGLADIARVTELVTLDAVTSQTAPRVSGSLAAHYAPTTPLHFCDHADTGQLNHTTVYMGCDAPLQGAFHAMPRDAAQYAQQLYAALHSLDGMAYQRIAVQPVPNEPAWAGVADRLSRAAATFT